MTNSNRKIILITGVTRGLGRALTKKLISLGHTVLGCGRSHQAIEELQREYGKPHDFSAVDVSNATQVQEWAERLLANYETPDLLLNNAALMNQSNPLWDVSQEEFDQVIDVNIKGVANVLRSFIPAMIQRGTGIIVNFSSGWGRSVSPDVAPYCATKYAIEGLTLALAQELPTGMGAIPLNPGIIDTDMLRVCFGSSASSYPSPDAWVERAARLLLELGPKDNGKSLSV